MVDSNILLSKQHEIWLLQIIVMLARIKCEQMPFTFFHAYRSNTSIKQSSVGNEASVGIEKEKGTCHGVY